MGFFKFLKREKKESLDELDLPPAPPPLEGFEENLPELPEVPEWPSFEEKISAPKEEMSFELPEETPDLSKEEPKFPNFPEMEETMPTQPITQFPPISTPITPSIPEPPPTEQEPIEEEPSLVSETYPKIAGRLFAKEKRLLHERPTGKTIYVRVDKFKATLGSINMARSDLRKSEEALARLENIKNAKDKSFDKVKVSLDDLQGKFIFIDKTLFKGD